MYDYEMLLELTRKELDSEIDGVARALGKVNYVLQVWNRNDFEVAAGEVSKIRTGCCLAALNVVQQELKTTMTRLINIRYGIPHK